MRVVAAGDALLAPPVTRRIIEQFARRPVDPEVRARLETLTQREREVLAMLGLRDRVQAVVLAYESGLVTPGG